MSNFTHFSLEERITIQNELNSHKSFKTIAEQLGKAPSSISRDKQRAERLYRSCESLSFFIRSGDTLSRKKPGATA